MDKNKKILIVWIAILGILSFIINYYTGQIIRNYIFNQCPKSMSIIEFQECYLGLSYFIIFFSAQSNFIIILLILVILSWLFCKIKRKSKGNARKWITLPKKEKRK